MVMELRKRKAPANPPPPAPVKKTRTTAAESKKKAAAKKAAAPKKAPAKKKTTSVVVPPEVQPAPVEKAPELEEKPEEKPSTEAEAKPTAEAEAKEEVKAPADPEAEAGASNSAPPAAPAKKSRAKAAAKPAKAAVAKAEAEPVEKLKVGDTLPSDLGEIELEDGTKTTVNALLEASDKGIVLFSYTKQGTSGCTAQACAMRDNASFFTDAGYRILGISGDSPANNAKFKANKKLEFNLICDPGFAFHQKMGIRSTGAKAGSVRSVIVLQKEGAIIKEHKTVTSKSSLDVAKKAVGTSEAAEAPAPSTAKADAEPAPEPAEAETKPAESS